jgi:glycosyltransferase involved in cell wall biosynthesis
LPIRGGGHKAAQINQRVKTVIGKEPSRVKALLKRLYLLQAKLFFMTQREALSQIHERSRHVKEMCELVDLFISPSQFLRENFIEYGIPARKILFSKYGHQRSYFSGFTKRESALLRFGYVGNLIPTKGIHVLVEAFNGVRSGEAELKIYGDFVPYGGFEDYPNLLQGLVSNKRIRFMGGYQHSAIADIMAEIDVLVVPSIWYENSPLTIHEAFLANTPVIASDIGGMAELVQDGVNGLLFRTGSTRDLRRKLERIIRQPDLIGRLSINIWPVKTIEENAGEIERIYHEVIAYSHSR